MLKAVPDSTPDPPTPVSLEALVAECIARFDEQGEKGIEAMCAEHPEQAEDLRRRMRGLADNGLLESWSEEVPEVLGDFSLLRPLGGGGMGVVYLARQESLAREVALKLIRPAQLYFPGARQRFRREVELVAQLQHPAIVPVFTFGEESGLPYFAMEHVRGCTLGEVLEELQGGDAEELKGSDFARAIGAHLQRTGGDAVVERKAALFDRSWAGACAAVLEALAQALAHAHERGILHRDLKPSNAMITADGRVQLFDFGLSTSQEAGKLTRTGNLLGSVPYMAPEQINGEELDERTDIYALGVTLYELLTLTQPFSGKGALAMRDAINAGGAEPPRSRNARIPRDLETICLKAMAVVPGDRYAGATELADDLGRFLARKPVRARRAGPVLHAWRWAQRHPWQTAAALLAVLLLVGGPVTFAVQRALANRDLTAALAQTRLERERAEGNLDRAIEAVEVMLVEVGGEELESVPGMGPRRARLLEEALALYDDLLAQRPDSPTLQRKHAKLVMGAAEVLMLLGRSDEAVARAERAIDMLGELARETGDWGVRWDRGKAFGVLGRIHNGAWNHDAAQLASLRAIEELESALAGSGDGELERRQGLTAALAQAQSNRALSLLQLEREEEALVLVREAIDHAERAVAMRSGDGPAHYALGSALQTRALLEPDPAAAVELTARALEEMQRGLADEAPDPARVLSLALLYQTHAKAVAEHEGVEAARRDFDAAYELLNELLEAHPYDEAVRVAATENRLTLSRLLPYPERPPLLELAIETLSPLVERRPMDIEIRRRGNLARTSHFWALVESGELERAAELADEVLEDSERFAADFPDDPDHWQTVFPHLQVGILDNLLGEEPRLDEIERLVYERAPNQERVLRGASMVFAMRCGRLDEEGGRTAERERLAERSLDLLEAALDAGFDRGHLLLGEERWSALRDHPRLHELVGSVE